MSETKDTKTETTGAGAAGATGSQEQTGAAAGAAQPATPEKAPAPRVVKITNHAARPVVIVGRHAMNLKPGVNTVDAAKWYAIKGNPKGYKPIAALLLAGRDGGLTESGEGESLDGLSEIDAYITVQAATDLDQLKKWHETETRQRIRQAIIDQAKKVDEAAKKIAAKTKAK
jgi:hypothetical protein